MHCISAVLIRACVVLKWGLMRLRYIDGADWTEVAATINYEWAQTHRVHASALAKIKTYKAKRPWGILGSFCVS